MTKTKIISIFIIAIMLFSICLLMAGCPAEDPDDKKYDVSMKIVCKEIVNGKTTGPILGEWIFTPDVSVIRISREYDGKQYDYYLDSYNLPDHPRWSNYWLEPTYGGANRFSVRLGIKGQTGEDPKCVYEKGEYCLSVLAAGSSDIWNYRSISLYITVS